jgi:hypothetical protein
VHQMGDGWWRLHFDDIRCKRMILRGLQVVGAAHSTFPGMRRANWIYERWDLIGSITIGCLYLLAAESYRMLM